MATDRQIAANRLNAKLCTGPKTRQGKAVASQNAVTHGLLSECGLLRGERAEDFSGLRGRIFAELAPCGALEGELAERIASLLWRLRRVPAFEAALIAWADACREEESVFAPGEPRLAPCFFDDDEPGRVSQRDILVLGRSLDAFLKRGLGAKLNRYETALQRQLSAILQELREMQAQSKAKSEPKVRLEAAAGEGGAVVPRLALTVKDAAHGEEDPEGPAL